MKYPSNVEEVVRLNPSFMGFVMYKKSPRYVSLNVVSELAGLIPPSIKKVAVLVDEPIDKALEIAESGFFDFLQLHGNEDPAYCKKLSHHAGIIKAFHVSGTLPDMIDYQDSSDMFLLDTAGPGYGGTGKKFNHDLLKEYSGKTQFLLSGGISPDDADIINTLVSEKIKGLDLNSRFEISPGLKDVNLLKIFLEKIRCNYGNS